MLRERTLVVMVFVICGLVMTPGFCLDTAGDELNGMEGVDESGNLFALKPAPEMVSLDLSPDMVETYGSPVEAVCLGQEDLGFPSEGGPIPMAPPFLGEVLLYSNQSSDDRSPRIAYNPVDGYLWAVFTHHNGVDEDVYVSSSDDMGQTWNLVMWTAGQYNETEPAIAISGNTIMVFYEQDKVGGEQDTYFLMSQDGGSSWGTYFLRWDWTNQPQSLQLEDFNNFDVSVVTPFWFHFAADVYGVRNSTRTVAFAWTENGGTMWSMAYLPTDRHIGEDSEHPAIMENNVDNYMHIAFQRWNTTEASWDVQWLVVDHGLSDITGYWTANIDGGRSDIAPDLYVRGDYAYVIWQNGTLSPDLTAFFSDDGGRSTIWILFITRDTPSDETYPSVTIDSGHVPHIAFSNNSVTYYGTNPYPLIQPFTTSAVSEDSVTTSRHRLLDLISMSDDLGVAWTDARNTYTDIYFSRAPSNLPPVAVAKPLYQEVSNGQTTWLYGNESYDTDGTIVNYSWQITGPSGPMQLWGDIVSFVPTAEGLHNATLTILDDGGLDDSTVVYVNVGFVPTLIPPVAEAGDNMVAFLSENVTFDGSASYDPDGSIIDYHWDFDDGTQASGTIVNHTFSSVGRYYVDLTVTDDDNLSDSDVVLVLVLDPAPYAPVLTRTTLTGASQSELTIEWELSSDDGSGFDDVINYAVYWGDSYDSSGAGYHFLTELPPGTTSLTLAGWGDGDWSDYFVYVQANDTDGYTNWKGQAGKFVRFMEAGKRIASVPLVQDDETLETVLQSLTGSYNHVRYYKSSDQSDHWKSYWTFKTYRTLFEINHKMGFWIQITKDDHLVVAGLVPEVTEIQLGHQWNLVGYPCFFDDSVGGALSAIDWTKIDGYSDTPPYHLRHLSPADIMTAGEGYWIWVDVPQVWMVEN